MRGLLRGATFSLRFSQRISRCKMSNLSPSPPICPKFIAVEDGKHVLRDARDDSIFRLVSYNILAQVYVKSAMFPHSPGPSLKWKARSNAILTVLKSFEADFLCIQELDEYDTFYKGNMEALGYSSIYVKRSEKKKDGCGIFYMNERVQFLLKEEIHYNDLVPSIDDKVTLFEEKSNLSSFTKEKAILPNAGSGGFAIKCYAHVDRGDTNDPRVRLKRDCVGIMAAFKLADPPHQLFIITTTHLYWDPEWPEVKIAQAKYLLSRVKKFRDDVSKKYDCAPPVIISGDFNSLPGSEVYTCMLSGMTSTSEGESQLPLNSLHAFLGGEPALTTCSPDFTGTLDYIFFSDSDSLKPISYIELSGPASSAMSGGFPNYHHPSDHLPIGADFKLFP
ncbi:carbon catabolite repressor protein 4 homolog 4 isoform X2 [Amborella trichopoda]|uniref:carbon catabolite repressor protein 4 homolog 4 isoform X2 n=1 Tax=Amborella trichopoda TaxID=13333 RepID=UPI0005D3AAB4|nr:carbon catabolite repressor protein 4 homolog 4 isoform X2 [Amborella trichopoda]|eukprot:XP_011624111.1 carbon catabolite repressor protein 4 homolog 4 isoform X2 [Amborella trichopoda]